MEDKTPKLKIYDEMVDEDAQERLRNLIRELRRSPEVYRKEFMGEWVEPIEYQPIYVLASTYQIAKSIFDHYFLFTGLARRIDLRYIDHIEKVYGLRNVYIVVSGERYPSESFYERLEWIRSRSPYSDFEVVNEQDLEKEQVREKVSRQRPQETKGK